MSEIDKDVVNQQTGDSPEQAKPDDEGRQENQAEENELNPEQQQEQEPEPEEKPEPQKPIINVRVSSDSMSAEIEFSRVATDTLNPTKEDIDEAIASKGIVYGINENYVLQLCERPVYNSPIEIAKGVPAKIGKDGYLTYLIETKRSLRPKERADGTMDYYDLGFIQNVTKGQALCEFHDAEKGDDGCNIFGLVLEGMFGRVPDVPIGKNTVFDKEKSIVVAASDGNVTVDPKGNIDVHDVLRIPGSIDNSTGNIFFSGDVIIGKDVASGFKIESWGNIVVKGTVEGANLKAKGDITVGEGINGMNRAKIQVGGSLKCKYIQNCEISTIGDIYADSIMYCSVECSGSIELSGKRGGIIGGKTIIAKSLVAKSLGNDAHVATHITMAAVGLQHNEKIIELKKKIVAIDNELITTVQTMNWCDDLLKKGKLKPFQANAYENAKARQLAILQERPELLKELDETQQELLYTATDDSFIKCSGHVHTGVRIIFGMQMLNVQSSFVNSRIYFVDGEIVTSPL